jgi:hypothetical protein
VRLMAGGPEALRTDVRPRPSHIHLANGAHTLQPDEPTRARDRRGASRASFHTFHPTLSSAQMYVKLYPEMPACSAFVEAYVRAVSEPRRQLEIAYDPVRAARCARRRARRPRC